MLVNKSQLARILKITQPTLANYISRHGDAFPVVERGGRGRDWWFDPEAVLSFLANHEEEVRRVEQERCDAIKQFALPWGHNGGPELEDLDLPGENLRPAELLTLMKVRRLQREEAAACGRLVDCEEVSDLVRRTFHDWGRAMRDMISDASVEARLSPEQEAIFEVCFREARFKLVESIRRKFSQQVAAPEHAKAPSTLFEVYEAPAIATAGNANSSIF